MVDSSKEHFAGVPVSGSVPQPRQPTPQAEAKLQLAMQKLIFKNG